MDFLKVTFGAGLMKAREILVTPSPVVGLDQSQKTLHVKDPRSFALAICCQSSDGVMG